MSKAPAWNERVTATVAQEGIAKQERINWRKVTVTSDPITGDIVVEYTMPTGASDQKRYSQTNFDRNGRSIARNIGFHVCP